MIGCFTRRGYGSRAIRPRRLRRADCPEPIAPSRLPKPIEGDCAYPHGMIRVGVFGAGGRMGSTVCGAVAADPELALVAAVDPYHAGIDLQQLGVAASGVQVARTASALTDAEADVA